MWNYKKIVTDVDITNLSEINSFCETAGAKWDEDTWRQETQHTHRDTKVILLIFDKDFRVDNPTKQKYYDFVKNDLQVLEDILAKEYGKGFLIRAVLVKLDAKQIIEPHYDDGASLHIGRRVHIPILTNDDVIFTVGGEAINMKKGDIIEINNTGKEHSVYNNGHTDRVHLIVDWMRS